MNIQRKYKEDAVRPSLTYPLIISHSIITLHGVSVREETRQVVQCCFNLMKRGKSLLCQQQL